MQLAFVFEHERRRMAVADAWLSPMHGSHHHAYCLIQFNFVSNANAISSISILIWRDFIRPPKLKFTHSQCAGGVDDDNERKNRQGKMLVAACFASVQQRKQKARGIEPVVGSIMQRQPNEPTTEQQWQHRNSTN